MFSASRIGSFPISAISRNRTSVINLTASIANIYHHILITGQSNSTGSEALPILNTVQNYQNRSFNTGVRAGSSNLTSFIPLVEALDSTFNGQTIATSMTDFIWALVESEGRSPIPYLVSANGVPGARYDELSRGTAPYNAGIIQVQEAKRISLLMNKDYKVKAICNIHGESDQEYAKLNYGANVTTWQQNYEQDIKAVTQQTDSIPMLLCQQNAYSPSNASSPSTSTALEVWKAHKANPDKIVLVGPRYQYDHPGTTLHLSGYMQQWHGEQYGKVYKHVVVDGKSWRPLSPKTVTLNRSVIDVEFYVPAPPLVFDLSMIVSPNLTTYGFEYFDESSSPPTITSVLILNPTTIRITLASPPTGAGQLRYAYTGTGAGAGHWNGSRGNLRDSDATPSLHGYPLYNWCIQFAWDLV